MADQQRELLEQTLVLWRGGHRPLATALLMHLLNPMDDVGLAQTGVNIKEICASWDMQPPFLEEPSIESSFGDAHWALQNGLLRWALIAFYRIDNATRSDSGQQGVSAMSKVGIMTCYARANMPEQCVEASERILEDWAQGIPLPLRDAGVAMSSLEEACTSAKRSEISRSQGRFVEAEAEWAAAQMLCVEAGERILEGWVQRNPLPLGADGVATLRFEEASTFTNESELYRAQGRFAEAEAGWAMAQIMYDEQFGSGNRLPIRAYSRFARASCLRLLQRNAAAKFLLADAQELVDALSDDDLGRSIRTDVRVERALNFHSLAEYRLADDCFAEAMALYEASPDSVSDRRARADCYRWRALNMNRLVESDPRIELWLAQALALFDLSPDTPELRHMRATVRSELGLRWMGAGRKADAEPLFHQAQDLLDDVPGDVSRERALARENRATCLSEREAVVLLQDAQAIFDRLAESPLTLADRVRVRKILGISLDELGEYASAESVLIEALALGDSLAANGLNQRDRAVIQMSLGDALRKQGCFDTAGGQYGAARMIFDRLPDSEVARQDRALVRLAQVNLLSSHFESTDDIKTLCGEASELLSSLVRFPISRYYHLQVFNHLANYYCAMGALEQANRMLYEAQRLLETLPKDDVMLQAGATLAFTRARVARAMGEFERAEEQYRSSQNIYDSLPYKATRQLMRARIRQARASLYQNRTLQERLCTEARELYDGLPDSPATREFRAHARILHGGRLWRWKQYDRARQVLEQADSLLETCSLGNAVELRAMSKAELANMLNGQEKHEEAEAVHVETAGILATLSDSEDVRKKQIAHLSSRAVNLSQGGNPLFAMELSEHACELAESLSDRAPNRTLSAVVHANLLFELARAGNVVRSRDILTRLLKLIEQTYIYGDVDTTRILRVTAFRLCDLHRIGAIDAVRCEAELRKLSRSCMDWLDAMPVFSERGDLESRAGDDLRALVGVTLSWMTRNGSIAQVPGLLAEYHGRFFAAQLAAHAPADGDRRSGPSMRHRIGRLLRRTHWRLQAMESIDASHRDASPGLRLERMRRRHGRLREVAVAIASRTRQAGGMTDALPEGQHLGELLGTAPDRLRALVVLLRVDEPREDEPWKFDESHPTPLALVLTAARAQWRAVKLPDVVWRSAAGGSARGHRSVRRGNAATRVADACGLELRHAVRSAWDVIRPELDGASEIIVGVHHELAHLPWQTLEDGEDGTTLRLHHGISLAVQALQSDLRARVRPPSTGRSISVLAHSPNESHELDGHSLPPIPCVAVDFAVTASLHAAHRAVAGRHELLQSTCPLLQLSCHGWPGGALTGPSDGWISPHELAASLRSRSVEALLMLACCTGRAQDNAWGEAVGWPALLQGPGRLILAPLYPVDDLFCSLFALLLHHHWLATQDLRKALRETRMRLRSGEWDDDPARCAELEHAWTDSVAAAWRRKDDDTDRGVAPAPVRAARYARQRRRLYDGHRDLQLVAEAFVLFG